MKFLEIAQKKINDCEFIFRKIIHSQIKKKVYN